jgi:magnesium-transporting ATPase (P-type)
MIIHLRRFPHFATSFVSDDNFASIIAAVREGRVVWDNLRKVLLVNTAINNAQGLSVLFGIACGLGYSPLSSIQVLYSNLICACSLGFVTAVEPAEEGIMDQPPRRVNKRLAGRFFLLRIAVGTVALVVAVIGASFWAQRYYGTGTNGLPYVRAQALNVLNFGAISITASARFARKSAFHVRSFQDNKIALYSYALVVVLQVFIIYCPVVNILIFSQAAMEGFQWGVTILMAFGVLVVMEVEKCVRNYLTALQYDTDDRDADDLFDREQDPDTSLPEEAERFGKNELLRR